MFTQKPKKIADLDVPRQCALRERFWRRIEKERVDARVSVEPCWKCGSTKVIVSTARRCRGCGIYV